MSVKGLFNDYRDYLTMLDDEDIRDFVGAVDWFLNQRNLEAVRVPGVRHMQGLDQYSSGHELRLVNSLLAELDTVQWMRIYSEDEVGSEFHENWGYLELLGGRGHFDSSQRAGGFYLQGPNQNYKSHKHVAEELFIPLTEGSLWMRDNGEFVEHPVGEVIVHESNEVHSMRTNDKPLLALWMWRDGDLMQKPEF
ncbi:MAG: dimethylsulfonioproprionate lyase family protein [Rhizobiaceae bacterium]